MQACDRCGDTAARADPIATIIGPEGETEHYHLGCIPEEVA